MKQERFCRYGTVRDKHERGWVLFLPPRLAMFTVLAQEDDNSMPQQRGEGTFYISVALERSRHIAWFETVNIMNLRTVTVVSSVPFHIHVLVFWRARFVHAQHIYLFTGTHNKCVLSSLCVTLAVIG